jgi:hypothetical protein
VRQNPNNLQNNREGDIMAIFPFQTLEHSFVIGGLWGNQFDTQKEKESNQNLRVMLVNMKQKVSELVDTSNPRAVQNGDHYIRALDAHLAVCDGTDAFLIADGNSISQKVTRRSLSYSVPHYSELDFPTR